MKLYSFSGANNPFTVRYDFYRAVDKFVSTTGKEPTELQYDLMACVAYHKNYGLGGNVRDINELFRTVNDSIRTNISDACNIITLAAYADELRNGHNKELIYNSNDLVDVIDQNSIQSLEELACVSGEEYFIDAHALAEGLRGYVSRKNKFPKHIEGFVRKYVDELYSERE